MKLTPGLREAAAAFPLDRFSAWSVAKYLTSKGRAELEAEAERAPMEVWWRRRRAP